MSVLAVVPARSGSKGIPGKNVRDLGGKPLLAHQIENARSAESIDRTVVSTDDEEFAAVAKEFGAEVPFMRPDRLAADDVPVIAVYQHALESLADDSAPIDLVVGLQPTCPFTRPDQIDAAVRKARRTGCDSVVSVTEVLDPHPYNTYSLEGDRLEPLEGITVEEPLQRQDRPSVYALTGAIFVRRPSVLGAWDGTDFALGDDVRAIEQAERESLDVDTPHELVVARALLAYDCPTPDEVASGHRDV